MPARPDAEKAEQDSRGSRLDSWKEIAGYLNRHVTTIRRWEKHEGLPVHRHRHARLGSIYAYTRELDAWFESRREEVAIERQGRVGIIRTPSPASDLS